MTADRKAAMEQARSCIYAPYENLAAAFREVTAELEQERKAREEADRLLRETWTHIKATVHRAESAEQRCAAWQIQWDGLLRELEQERKAHKQTSRQANEAIETTNQRAADLQARLDRVEAVVFNNLPYLENLIISAGHESGLMRDHPKPCVGHDFCLMRQAKKGAAAIRALAPTNAAGQEHGDTSLRQEDSLPASAAPNGVIEGLDLVAQICNEESQAAWKKFKSGGPAEQGNPYWEGFSDGAEQILASVTLSWPEPTTQGTDVTPQPDPALPGLKLAKKICEYNKRYTFETGDLLISEAHGRDADAIRAEIAKRTK